MKAPRANILPPEARPAYFPKKEEGPGSAPETFLAAGKA